MDVERRARGDRHLRARAARADGPRPGAGRHPARARPAARSPTRTSCSASAARLRAAIDARPPVERGASACGAPTARCGCCRRARSPSTTRRAARPACGASSRTSPTSPGRSGASGRSPTSGRRRWPASRLEELMQRAVDVTTRRPGSTAPPSCSSAPDEQRSSWCGPSRRPATRGRGRSRAPPTCRASRRCGRRQAVIVEDLEHHDVYFRGDSATAAARAATASW